MTKFFLIAALVIAGGCTQKQEQQPPQQAPAPGDGMLESPHQTISQGPSNSAGGVHWTVPAGWQEQGARQMRIATYTIPAASGDAGETECAVFYFGTNQGGDVGMNIDRWASQFEGSPTPVKGTEEVHGMHVTTVRINGTYLAPSGPKMESQGSKANYRLLGAIVEAPEGSVFFKLTGPAKSVGAAEAAFASLVQSLAPSAQM